MNVCDTCGGSCKGTTCWDCLVLIIAHAGTLGEED
jgi:hypothetical protein